MNRALEMLYYLHAISVTQLKTVFVYKCTISRTRLISNMAAKKFGQVGKR